VRTVDMYTATTTIRLLKISGFSVGNVRKDVMNHVALHIILCSAVQTVNDTGSATGFRGCLATSREGANGNQA